MPTLNPAENFPIIRVLQDHTDVSTNYVQAVIRDASTDVVLATVNLTDLGNRRFRYIWKVPYDNTFQVGRFVVITTTVYTDAAYTNKNPSYAEVGDTYLVQERWNQLKASPGGADGVSEKTIRAILTENVAAIAQLITGQEKPEKIDLENVVARIMNALSMTEMNIKGAIPAAAEPTEPVDFTPLMKHLDTLHARVAALPQEHQDLTPLVGETRALGMHINDLHRQALQHAEKQFTDAKMELVVKHSLEVGTPPESVDQIKKRNFMKSLAARYGIKIK